jgi:drug/metabolite transporter superfamily protein YnfA
MKWYLRWYVHLVTGLIVIGVIFYFSVPTYSFGKIFAEFGFVYVIIVLALREGIKKGTKKKKLNT